MTNKDEKRICPDCEMAIEFLHEMETDWYGHLAYWYCSTCETEFVSRNGGELELAAP